MSQSKHNKNLSQLGSSADVSSGSSKLEKATTTSTATNPRGIPYAPFIEDINDIVSSADEVKDVLSKFQEMISKYQFMEFSTSRKLLGLKEKLPDIQKTLDSVQFLHTRTPQSPPLDTVFEFCDTLYAKAQVPYTKEVYLWLGANVMLSYPIPEAIDLLQSKLTSVKSNIGICEEDLDFLREQITTLEVATARVYNWEVAQRRKDSIVEKSSPSV